ncbi:hypothetical protein [uncultured Mediterranean phage uvMED]|nr:hypothetical protein [uncultured Mediterranean phage uvMED]
MTRYRTYGKLDDRMREVGDTGFAALASRDEPSQLQAGVVSESKNLRLDDGKATTRLGYTTQIDFANKFLADEFGTPLMTENSEIIQLDSPSSQNFFGASYFGGIGIEDRNQIVIIQDDRLLLHNGTEQTTKYFETNYTFDPNLPVFLDFVLGLNESEEAFTTGDKVEIVQFNNQLILLSGKGVNLPISLDFPLAQKVQKWNGEEGAEFIEDTNIPNGDFGVVTGNRLAIKTQNDEISFSDIANESNFDVLAKFNFGAGDGDDIIGLAPIPESSALVFKRRSLWAITGLNQIESAFITQVSKQTGCVSRHSIQNVGSAVFFLADSGVYALNIGLDASNARGTLTRFDLKDQPLSKPINDQILAENFTEAEVSCRSIFFNNRYYLSFVDGGRSRVYIFNTLMGAWESRDEYEFPIRDFIKAKTKVDSNERLYALSRFGKLLRMDDGNLDEEAQINWALNTRAYDNQNLEVKNFRRGYVKVESLDETGTTDLSVDVTDPDKTFTIPLARPNNEGYIERFTIGKRGNSLMYKFSGTGRNAIKHLRAEFIESQNNLISTNQ